MGVAIAAPATLSSPASPKLLNHFSGAKNNTSNLLLRSPVRIFTVSAAAKKQQQQLPPLCAPNQEPGEDLIHANDEAKPFQDADYAKTDLGWLPAFPHVLLASMANFLFGYHIGLMNGPIVSIARELGFEGNSFLEGLVVSIFIAGAFFGSIGCGTLVNKYGCRRTFQLDSIPLILGAVISAQAHTLDEMLLGRFLVGLGIGVNTVLVPIYISEVAPTKYRGSLGTVCQIGTCLGIIASLYLGIASENDPHWWRTMLYIASGPGLILSVGMKFAVESPRWLCRVGKLDDAKEVILNLWGKSEVDKAMDEFKSVISNDSGDLESRWLELLEKPHSRGCIKLHLLEVPFSYFNSLLV